MWSCWRAIENFGLAKKQTKTTSESRPLVRREADHACQLRRFESHVRINLVPITHLQKLARGFVTLFLVNRKFGFALGTGGCMS